jgi:hypothetical protein
MDAFQLRNLNGKTHFLNRFEPLLGPPLASKSCSVEIKPSRHANSLFSSSSFFFLK